MSNYCIHRDLLCKIGIDENSNNSTQMCTAQNGIFHQSVNTSDKEKYNEYPRCLEDNAPFVIKDNSTNHSYLDDKLMVESIKKDDMKQFMSLLKENPQRNMSERLNYGYEGNTILHEAIYWNANKILNFLLKHVCSETLKAKNIDKNTVLHLATLKQLDWVVHMLQITYPSVNQVTPNYNVKGDTPFLCAIRTGSETLVNLYLNLCDPYQLLKEKNSVNNFNALHVAVTTPNKNLNIIKMLVKHGVDMLDKCEETTTHSPIESTTLQASCEPRNSILEDLEKQPRTPLNLEIQTYLVREFYKLHTNNISDQKEYHTAIKEHPEYSAFEVKCNSNVQIDIDYDRTLNDKDLYRPLEQTALKVFPKQLKKDFLKNNST